MLKLKNVKKLLIVVLAITLIALIQAPVQATSPVVVTNGTSTNTIQTIPTVNSAQGTTTVTNKTTNTANTVSNNNTNSTYTNTNLPHAGVDYSVLFVIVACVISGVYAYIKIRDYNDIQY